MATKNYTKLDAVGSTSNNITFETPIVDTSKDKDLGRLLQGRPTYLDDAVGERLMPEGLAAKTDEGWVRGWKWHQFYGG